MSECCNSEIEAQPLDRNIPVKGLICPGCGQRGKAVQTVTLKCLLKPEAMPRLEPSRPYQFCPASDCSIVYYSPPEQFSRGDLQVPVFQKDQSLETPVCYCFGIARGDIQPPLQERLEELIELVRSFVQAGKCACEYRNPQGSCCLGNLTMARLQYANQ